MRLSDLFTGRSRVENHVDENGRGAQSQYARMAGLNRQIHSLVPGQTIRGEILSRNGSEVQIRLSDDMVMNARVDQNIALEPGKNVTFEVKSNGGTLSLSPLFTNIATDANVLKALDMAGLPVNDISVGMTEQLMQAGLPVNRNTLLQIYREINSFPETGASGQGRVSDVVNLHKLNLPVNAANVQQMESYRNLTHQLIRGMTSILDALPEAVGGMLAAGKETAAAGLYRELFAMIQEGTGEASLPGGTGIQNMPGASEEANTANAVGETGLPNGSGTQNSAGISGGANVANGAGGAVETGLPGGLGAQNMTDMSGNTAAANGTGTGEASTTGGLGMRNMTNMSGEMSAVGGADTEETDLPDGTGIGNMAGVSGEANGAVDALSSLSARERAVLAEKMMRVLDELQLSPGRELPLREQLQQFARGELSADDFFQAAARLLDAAQPAEGALRHLQQIFSGREFQKALMAQLKELWTLAPEDLSVPGKVEELYRRIDRQIRGLLQALESGGQQSSAAYRGALHLSQSVDFMNQINQFYAYVQLPLRLHQSEAHGDLYVYMNKKSLAEHKGQVSALLHLDMEHLGPLDVYVTLQEAKVNTKFYVANEEILDFIEKHMDILTARLQKRGYSCSISASARGEQEKRESGGLSPLLQQEKGILLSQYAFDVRT